MGVRITRRVLLAAFGIASVAALSVVVDAWSVGAPTPFTLPMGGGTVPQIWTGPGGVRVGVKVKVATGEVRVEAPVGTGIGHVIAGGATVFEGNWPSLNVVGFASSSEGTYTKTTNDSIGSLNRLIGGDTLTLPLPGGGTAYNVYSTMGAQVNLPRLFTVRAGLGAVSVLGGAVTLLTLEPGDSTFCSKKDTNFSLSGSGSIDWAVFDMPVAAGSPNWSQTGTASCQTGDTSDSVFADGNANLSITLTNHGPGDLTLVACTGGTAPASPLAPNASTTVTGNITAFSWNYGTLGTSVTWLVKKP